MRVSNFRSLKTEDNVCKRLYVSRPFVPATLSRRRRHDYVRRRHAAGRTSTPLQRYVVFMRIKRFRDRIFFIILSFMQLEQAVERRARAFENRSRSVRETSHQIAMIMSFQYNTGERTTMFRGQSSVLVGTKQCDQCCEVM